MSGYGPLYWPWSCPAATVGVIADDNNNSRTAAAVSVVIAAAAVIAVAGEQDERAVQTAAGVPVDGVVTCRSAATAVVVVAAVRIPRWSSWVTTVLIGRRR